MGEVKGVGKVCWGVRKDVGMGVGKCVWVWGEVRGDVGRGVGNCSRRCGKVCWGLGGGDVGRSVLGLPMPSPTLCPSLLPYTPTHFPTPISTLPTSPLTPEHTSFPSHPIV